MGKLEIYILALAFIGLGSASKCPEPRKPHPTSCTVFYNCVNLPSGGYVWAPAKCTNGLVFQPYLRICVLPGDSWTCDILATEPPETTTDKIPELIDSTQTSYLGYGEGDPSVFGEPTDYYKVEKYSEPLDGSRETVTPYPLIEVTQPNNYVNQIDSTIQNIGLPIAIKHSEDNYLYRFVNGHQVLATPANANGDQLQAHLERLTQLIERLVAYQSVGIPLDRQPQTTVTTTTTGDYLNNYNNKFSNDNRESAVLNFLVKNYVAKSQSQATKSLPEIGAIGTTAFRDQESAATVGADSLDVVLNGPQAADNIVAVSDSLDNRQYFTISKYKSVAHQLTTETVELLPCTSGVRLPNSTDCTKYYSCDPNTAKIQQFSCPENTAFNQYKRLCERHEFEVCKDGASESTLRISPTTSSPRTRDSSFQVSETSPCQAIGKHGDPTSDNHYYLCYSDKGKSTDFKYQRMACPNSLVFCQTKNLCTTRKRCQSI